jgi:U32 family peptidase
MSHNPTKNKPELLAPAGSVEAFFAAMENGADAVYAGLNEFSARAKAKNFTLPQMEKITAYAHSLGRRVYVTLNTLVQEQELAQVVEILSALEAMGTDGVILQDMAIYRLIREYFPGIPLHASTQMTIHNSAGVRQLEQMGFERVVLARELHIDEIGAIAKSTRMEIECFIHGALCFSFSGQCYFSSFLGGLSGNRGRCAQPCRRQYKYKGKDGYYFSTNDFSSIDMLPQLVDAGVASFKIEGRMKSAEYVASVIGAYRRVLDAPVERRSLAIAEAKELLKLSFGRVPTKGFLVSHNPTDIATPSLTGATGRYLGEIQSIRDNRITFPVRDRLHVGDRIRVQPKSDMAGRAFTVKDLSVDRQQVKLAKAKSVVTTTAPFSFKPGDAVFKVSSETAFTMSENACRRKLESVKGNRVGCDLVLSMSSETMQVKARVADAGYDFEFHLGELEPARTGDMEEVLRGQFTKTGDTSFELHSLSAHGFPAVVIPAVRFKEIRRELFRLLAENALGDLRRKQLQAKKRALAGLVGRSQAGRGAQPQLIVRLESVRDFYSLLQEGVDDVSLPVSKANLHQFAPFARKLKGREGRVLWRLPFIIFEADLPFYREAVTYIAGHGFRRFEAANLGHFQLLDGLDVEITTDYRLFSLNSQALLTWRELGAGAATLYIEDDAENMTRLLQAEVPVRKRVLIHGGVPAITSKIRIKDVRSDTPVVSDRGEGYMVKLQDGLTVVTPTRMFSLTGQVRKLQEMGAAEFVIDLSNESREHWKAVLGAFARSETLPGTSEFNFTNGLV